MHLVNHNPTPLANHKRGLVLLPVLALLAGCAGHAQLGGDPALTVVSANELPPPDRVGLSSEVRPHYIGAYDKLIIDVYGIPELSAREVQVDAAGRVSFPIAGYFEVAGKTPTEVELLVADRLRANFVRSPQVSVNLTETVSQVVTVEGQVKRPGIYPVVGRMTLMRAIAKAEGTDEFSDLRYIVVFRTVQEKRLAALYNLKSIRHGAAPDPEIYANDVIMVDESRARRVFKDILQTLPALTTPIIVAVDRLTR